MAAANSALITRQPDASRAHTIGVKVDDDRSCNPARDEVDVAGERVGIACRDSVQQNSVPSIVS
jgi:Tfp pilus assembly protein PilZ